MMPSYSTSCKDRCCRSRNGRSSGCIPRILRRILCFNSLPSSPFDHFKEKEKEALLECNSSTPGLVARLMGLDSLPRVESIDGSPSVNSVDHPCKKYTGSSRRQIIPTYQELEDENFFILSFEKGCESVEFSKVRKKSSRTNMNRDKENLEVHKVLKGNSDKSHLKVRNTRDVLSPLKNSNRTSSEKMKKKKVKEDRIALIINSEIGGDHSENSSPNSVLDLVEFPSALEAACNPGDITRLANSKLRRTLSEEIENCRKCNEKKLFNEEETQSRLRNIRHHNYDEKWYEVLKLAAREMANTSWVGDKILKNHFYFKEIGRNIASEILDQLITELLMDL